LPGNAQVLTETGACWATGHPGPGDAGRGGEPREARSCMCIDPSDVLGDHQLGMPASPLFQPLRTACA
jgi:hypothetical protein